MLRHRYGDHYLHNEPLAIIIKLNFYHISISFPIRPSPVSTCGTDRKASQLTDVSMYRLAKVEVASLYPRIQEGAPNRGYRIHKQQTAGTSLPATKTWIVRMAASSL
ncbi:Dihydroorotate dehydrogenase (quinone) [Trichinella pseudospiralis]